MRIASTPRAKLNFPKTKTSIMKLLKDAYELASLGRRPTWLALAGTPGGAFDVARAAGRVAWPRRADGLARPGWLDLVSTGSKWPARPAWPWLARSGLDWLKLLASNTRNVLLRIQGMSCVEHQECLASNTRNVLLRTPGMSCCIHKECPASNTWSVLLRTQGMSCLQRDARGGELLFHLRFIFKD